jgi:dipeptidyl aminopeptidase/acylaminoacyl peptidase
MMKRILTRAAATALALALATQGFGQPARPAPTQASAPIPIPIERFAELPVFGEPLLSPDGTRIAARYTDGTNDRIGIWTVGGGETRQLRSIIAPNTGSFHWAGNGRLLINTTNLVILVGFAIIPIPVRRVVSYDVETGRGTALGTGGGLADEVIFTDPDGRFVLLSSQTSLTSTPSVLRVDLATGASSEVQRSRRGIWSWFADSHGVVRVGVDYGERRTRIYYRDAPGGELRLVDNDRAIRDDSVVDLIRFVDDTSRGIVVTNAETGRFAVYEYNFATDTRGATLFEHPEVDVTTPIFARNGTLTGVSYETDRPHIHWIDPDLASIQQAIDRTFRGKTNQILNSSRDGNRMLVWSAGADDPGTYYVYDRAARRMEMFASPYDGLHELAFAPVRPVSYQSRDGLTIRGYLTLPPGRGERGLPLIVLPHGGPFVRDSWVFDQEVQFLASRGYAVLQPNFRGSTGYGRDFVARGYGQLGGGMIDDIEDGIDWLVGQGTADRGRVCIMGSSYGGYAAMWAATRSPERYRCAISWAGPTDLRAMVRYDTNAFVPRRYVREFRQRIEGEERTDLNAISPLRQQQRLRVPVLVGHGENDITVPVDQSRRLVDALRRRRAEHEAVVYAKAGHSFTMSEERADWLRRIEAFLARHNPAGPVAAAP